MQRHYSNTPITSQNTYPQRQSQPRTLANASTFIPKADARSGQVHIYENRSSNPERNLPQGQESGYEIVTPAADFYSPYQRATPRLVHRTDSSGQLSSGSQFRVRAASWFKVGKVFKAYCPEIVGTTTAPGFTCEDPRYGEVITVKIRWLVIVRVFDTWCLALPIQTYAGDGVGRSGTVKSSHAIFYTGDEAPQPHPNELPRLHESGMREPIRVIPNEEDDILDPMCRINFQRVYTIEKSSKVCDFGLVDPADERKMLEAFWHAMETSQDPPFGPTSGNQNNTHSAASNKGSGPSYGNVSGSSRGQNSLMDSRSSYRHGGYRLEARRDDSKNQLLKGESPRRNGELPSAAAAVREWTEEKPKPKPGYRNSKNSNGTSPERPDESKFWSKNLLVRGAEYLQWPAQISINIQSGRPLKRSHSDGHITLQHTGNIWN